MSSLLKDKRIMEHWSAIENISIKKPSLFNINIIGVHISIILAFMLGIIGHFLLHFEFFKIVFFLLIVFVTINIVVCYIEKTMKVFVMKQKLKSWNKTINRLSKSYKSEGYEYLEIKLNENKSINSINLLYSENKIKEEIKTNSYKNIYKIPLSMFGIYSPILERKIIGEILESIISKYGHKVIGAYIDNVSDCIFVLLNIDKYSLLKNTNKKEIESMMIEEISKILTLSSNQGSVDISQLNHTRIVAKINESNLTEKLKVWERLKEKEFDKNFINISVMDKEIRKIRKI